MSKKNYLILAVFIIITAVVISCALLFESLGKVKDNPQDLVGNTAGNLNNEGLFVEDNEMIYFINPLDNGYIYSMTKNCSDIKLRVKSPAKYLNIAGDYMYYNQVDSVNDTVYGFSGNTNGIYSYKLGSKNDIHGIDRTASGTINVIGNYIYYEHYDTTDGMTLYRANIKDRNKEQVSKSIIDPSCVIGGNIYYPNQDDYSLSLSVFNTDSLTANPYSTDRMYNLAYENGYIYYIIVGKNYELCRYDLRTQAVEVLTEDRVDCFNILDGIIFYQKNSKTDPQLIIMNNDGSNKKVIASGNYTNISMTSNYTFFKPIDDERTIYMVPTSGGSVSNFTALITASMAEE